MRRGQVLDDEIICPKLHPADASDGVEVCERPLRFSRPVAHAAISRAAPPTLTSPDIRRGSR